MVIEPVYQPRHVSGPQLTELVNLYHLARTALSGQRCGRYERLCWAAAEFHKINPAISVTAAYKDLSNSLA